jgi:hypothetical protein
MNPLLLQIVMAALGQMGGLTTSPGLGMPAPLPVNQRQVASLATATCLMRSGRLSRQDAIGMLQRQGRRQGWADGWGRRISLGQLDSLIRRAGGCPRIISQIAGIRQPLRPQPIRRRPVLPEAESGRGSRSAREGFGLAPYR